MKCLEGIEVVRLEAEDVVRHRLVKDIIIAYSKSDEKMRAKREEEKQKKESKKLEEEAKEA